MDDIYYKDYKDSINDSYNNTDKKILLKDSDNIGINNVNNIDEYNLPNNENNNDKKDLINENEFNLNTKIFIDKLIDSLPIKFHYVSLIIIGVLCFLSYGYLLEHFKFSTTFYYSFFYWENINITTYLVVFVTFNIMGIMLSQNIFSDLKNSFSSLIFSIMILISLILIIVMEESEIYVFSMFVISLSLGILKSSTFTFILDNFSQKYRRMILIFIYGSTIFGSLASKIVTYIFSKFSDSYKIYYDLWFLLVIWILSPLFMIYLSESIRYNYYKSNSYSFSEIYISIIDKEYLEDPCVSELMLLNDTNNLIKRSKSKLNLEKLKINYSNYFTALSFLFKNKLVVRTLLGFLLVFIQSLIFYFIIEIEPFFISDLIYTGSSNFFYKKPQHIWISLVMESINLVLISALGIIFFFWKNKKHIWLSLITHSIILILVILLLSLQTNYLYFMSFIKVFSMFNFITTLIHIAEKTLTISRNGFISFAFAIDCLSYLIIFLFRIYLVKYMLLIGTISIIVLIPPSFALELYFKTEFIDDDDIGKSDIKIFKELYIDKRKTD